MRRRWRPPLALLALIFVGPSAVLLALTAAIYGWARIEPPRRLGPEERAAVVGALRAALEGGEATAPELRGWPAPGPVVVTVWVDGVERIRVRGRGGDLSAAVRDAATALIASPELATMATPARRRARIKVDRVTGYGPLVRSLPVLDLFALHPGIDGVAATLGDRTILLLPQDLIVRRLLAAQMPVAAVPDLHMGVDLRGIEMVAAARAAMSPEAWRAAEVRWRRFRTDAFVERAEGQREAAPVPLYRAQAPRPPLSSAALRAAALAGGRFLVSRIAPSGRYIYETDLATGRQTNPRRRRPYSLPRHAGATYFLAQLYRLTGEEFLREPIERAFAHLAKLVEEGGCEGTLPSGAEFACVVDRGSRVAGLGSTALTVVALAEFRRATGKPTYDKLARRLTEWILSMQRPDGSFAHLYNVPRGERDEHTQLLYFSGEAALALARMYKVYGDRRYLEATERGLDSLVGWYDFFIGAFFYGEEHWTCIAAEAVWPALKKDRYRRFCDRYGEFLRLQQPRLSDFPDQYDLVGTYTFTPFVPPSNTPAGSRTEAMLSAYLLGEHHKKPSAALKQQILVAMHYVLGQQVRPESDYWIPLDARGAIPASPVNPMVRIDYVQHVCSAMLRTAEMLEADRGR